METLSTPVAPLCGETTVDSLHNGLAIRTVDFLGVGLDNLMNNQSKILGDLIRYVTSLLWFVTYINQVWCNKLSKSAVHNEKIIMASKPGFDVIIVLLLYFLNG